VKSPTFWWRSDVSCMAQMLQHLGGLYGEITARRMSKKGQVLYTSTGAPVPVVCVGNFVVGGAGKTPTTLWLADQFRAQGFTPFILSRGYGGTLKTATKVASTHHTALEVGDEPLLMAHSCDVVVAKDRIAGAQLAISYGAKILIMDDGLQNPSLHKNIRLAVVDAQVGIGNGLCMPAGPLRAPLTQQLPFTDAVLLILPEISINMDEPQAAQNLRIQLPPNKPVFTAKLVPDPEAVMALRAYLPQKIIAFAGIGRPQKFFSTLATVGLTPNKVFSFPDHHNFTNTECTALLEAATRHNAKLVTTQKDYMRLAGAQKNTPQSTLYAQCFPLPIKLMPTHPEGFVQWALDFIEQ
jgi:tetraacyldisaccharide 4'-kinase